MHAAADAIAEGRSLIHRHVQDFLGSQDGGGQTQHMGSSLQQLHHREEIAALEESKKELGEEKANIEQEINNIETQLTELKTKRESQKTTIKQ